MSLINEINKKRKELGWSANKLANESNINRSIVSKMQKGEPKSSDVLEKMAEAMGCEWVLQEKPPF